jgi:tetrapyrrole methylase family protein/MazG family protein
MTDIHIVGLGITSIEQMTRQAEQAIRQSNEVLYLDTGPQTRRYLENNCKKVTPLFESSYVEGENRLNAYREVAARVIDAALSHAPVTFAVHGHPIVAVYAPFLIRDMAKLLDLEVDIQPGISAMDTVLADLAVDPCINGIQMYEATDLLLRNRPLQPDVPALIWQIGNLETRLHSARPSRPERFERFVAHLSQFYPADHRVIAIYSTPVPGGTTDRIDCTLNQIPEHAGQIHAGHTLFIPATGQRPIENRRLLDEIDSVSHLHSITEA